MTGDAIEDIPAGSSNNFKAAPFDIVTGAFVCDQRYLFRTHTFLLAEAFDSEVCQELAKVHMDLECRVSEGSIAMFQEFRSCPRQLYRDRE